MGVLLHHKYLGNSHVCKLAVGERGILCNHKVLARFDLVKEHFDWFLQVVQCLYILLILNEFSGHAMPVEDVEPTHKLDERFVGIPRDEVFCAFQTLVVNCSDQDIFQGTINVIENMLIMNIILLLMVRDGNVAVQRINGLDRHATMILWADECNLGVKCVLLIAHGNTHASMLPSSKIGFEFAYVCYAFLVHDH